MIERLIIGLAWGICAGRLAYVPVLPLITYVGLGISTIILKTYKKMYLSYRAAVNMLVAVIAQAIYLSANMVEA